MCDKSLQVLNPLQIFDLGMHFDPSAQANWSEGQERGREVTVTSWSWTTPGWMLRMLMVKSIFKCAIVYNYKQNMSVGQEGNE